MYKFSIKRIDFPLSCIIIVLSILCLIHLGNKQTFDFDSCYNMLSYQNLFQGKGFTYDYNDRMVYFDPVISTGPELYFLAYLIWLLQGSTSYFTAIYVLIGYYTVFLLFLNFYVLKKSDNKSIVLLIFISLWVCVKQLFSEYIILTPKGEPIAAILFFIGLYLLIEKRHLILASLSLGLALDVKPNIVIALFPVLLILFSNEFLLPIIKTKNFYNIKKILFSVGCCLFLILLPNLIHTKLVPFITLSQAEFKSYSEDRQNRAQTMLQKGFGHLLSIDHETNQASIGLFSKLLKQKYQTFAGYYRYRTIPIGLFFLSLPFFLIVSYRIDRFSFYLFAFTVATLMWWFFCPLDDWYRYFSLVDMVYIFASTVLTASFFRMKKKYLSLITLFVIGVIFIPRFSLIAINLHLENGPEYQKDLLAMADVVEKIPDDQIFTYGWFQAPQIMLLTNKRFNDFLDREKLIAALNHHEDVYFLETIENTLIEGKIQQYRSQFRRLYDFGFNHLSIIEHVYEPLQHGREDASVSMGWYDNEFSGKTKYRWTKPKFSVLIPGSTQYIRLDVLTPDVPEPGDKVLSLTIDNEEVEKILLEKSEWKTYQIKLEKPVQNDTFGVFEVNYQYCPKASGAGEDQRTLGVAIRKIEFLNSQFHIVTDNANG